MSVHQQIAVVCCSDTRTIASKPNIKLLKNHLESDYAAVLFGECLFGEHERSYFPQQRAEELMRFFRNPQVTHILDISGGNISNEILPYLDFSEIAQSNATFWGYSDLSAVINAIYTQTQKPCMLYNVRNILENSAREQEVQRFLTHADTALFDFDYEFINGSSMDGIVVGGNIRCFLKLAGTPYFPDMQDKILLLEAMSGKELLIVSMLSQLEQMGVFDQIKGIVLGTFLELDAVDPQLIHRLVLEKTHGKLPIARTFEIGHKTNSKAIIIGNNIHLK